MTHDDYRAAVGNWRMSLPPITVLEGDCRELLRRIPDGGVDLILGDPPYGRAYQSQRVPPGRRRPPIAGDATLHCARRLLAECDYQLWRTLHADRHCYLFCDWRFYPALADALERWLRLRGALVWVKGRGTGDRTGLAYVPAYELIAFFSKGQRRLHGHPTDAIWVGRTVKTTRLSAVQKDLLGLSTLIENSTEPGEIVLDPFAGSGATGAAAAMGCEQPRKAILIECDAEQAAICRQRLAVHGPVATELPACVEPTFAERMCWRQSQDEGRELLCLLEAAVAAVCRRAGLPPAVGPEAEYRRGFSTVKPQEWKRLIKAAAAADRTAGAELERSIADGQAANAEFDRWCRGDDEPGDWEYAGECTVCGCAEENACAGGCGWADATRMLCTACAGAEPPAPPASRGRK